MEKHIKMKISLLTCALIVLCQLQGKADVIYSPGFTIQQQGDVTPPDTNCETAPDNTCGLTSWGSAVLSAMDGSSLLGISDTFTTGQPFPAGWAPSWELHIAMTGSLASSDRGTDALAAGSLIGPQLQFASSNGDMIDIAEYPFYQWTIDRIYGTYLGVSYRDSQGQTHYGWVDFQWQEIYVNNRYPPSPYGISITIGGYAYEACANTAIAAGATSGGATCSGPPNDASAPEPGTLLLFGTGIVGVLYLTRSRRVPNAGRFRHS